MQFFSIRWIGKVRQTESLARVEPILRKLLVKNRNERCASADELILDSKKSALQPPNHRLQPFALRCIAVLPFANLNPEGSTEYFSDGLR